VELITDPTLIFLDEPTTGLDSFTATLVMDTLKELAMSGRTIISTIH
jgi:ABC-type multidrug transport system ATPase subunit